MHNAKLIVKDFDDYHVEFIKVGEYAKESKKEELISAFHLLVTDLKSYSKEKFNLEFTGEEIDEGVIAFLREYDIDILFASHSDSVLPHVRESRKIKYVIAKFITDIQTRDPAKFSTILKIAQGHAIASLITYDGIQNFSGDLSNVEVYIDAPIIFSLLGLNGESNLKHCKELVDALNRNGARLRVFDINYDEVINTVSDAISRLTTKNYDIKYSSRVLRTAVRENISAQQLQIKLNQLDSIIERESIKKAPLVIIPPSQYEFQIDCEKLKDLIKSKYARQNNNRKIENHQLNQIERDAESISNIFKIRKNNRAISLKNCKAIFLTNNTVIAFASKVFEKENWSYLGSIPVCVTDILLSTILWANYPTRNNNLNIKRLMSECYSLTELDNKLLNKYYDDVKTMHQSHLITDEQYYLLNASNVAYSLLEEKTLNDFDEYTDRTPREILEDLELRMNRDLDAEKKKNEDIDSNLHRIANRCGRLSFFVIAACIMILALLIKSGIQDRLKSTYYFLPLFILSGFIAVFGFLRWAEIIPTRSAIEKRVAGRIYKLLSKVVLKAPNS